MTHLELSEVLLSRRQVLAGGGAAALLASLAGLAPLPAHAEPADAEAKLAELTGGVTLQKGRISIEVPPYTEYGKQVRISIEVESPMTDADRVKTIHVLAERNTVPEVASYHFGPLAGQARISTRIRVATTQILLVAAEMASGEIYLAKTRVKVARGGGGCG
ncbi:MAG: hypothetical protein HQL36_10360 [Alphaproteobacteria bacterium]|nr:hypothetical protein [Alphaproteobacteria bacterium]MBF0251256.1 hypothetical protein [Alphaproteobacteria bacterium]